MANHKPTKMSFGQIAVGRAKSLAAFAFMLIAKVILPILMAVGLAVPAFATTFTTTVPGTSLVIPNTYPQAGGVVIVLTGTNGNVYYQYINPSSMYVGLQNNGNPAAWRGNPFQIGPAMTLNCGPVVSCSTYLGGGITKAAIRFTAQDGDNKAGEFDFNDLTLRFNGVDIANWSTIATETTNTAGTTRLASGVGFGNNTLDTGWFQTTNATLLANILATGTITPTIFDRDPNDNYWDFRVGSDANTAVVPLNVAPGVSLDKTVNPVSQTTFLNVGQVVNYSYAYRNIGSVWVENIAVSDNKIPSVSCPVAPVRLNPGDTKTCTGSYTVTQADVDAGFITNIATANGTPQAGSIGPLTDTVTITGPASAPGINLIKTASGATFGAAGTTVSYSFQVQNTGNVTLSSVAITDPLLPGLSCTIGNIAPGVTANAVCTGNTKTVTVADVDLSQISNTASVTARAPNGATVNDTASANMTGPARVPGIALRKTTGAINDTNGNGRLDAGDTQTYDFIVTNTGNVTLTAVTVSDPGATVTGGPLASLAPGAINTTTFKASRVITQLEMDAGSISNQASVTSAPPSGVTGPVIDQSHPTSNTGDAATISNLTRAPALTLDKTAAEANFAAVNDTINYTYLVRNTGNVTLTVPVTLTDNKIPSGFVCPAWPVGGLAPNATYSCTAPYTVVQADLDAGKVTNIASARSGTATVPVVTSSTDTVDVPAAVSPGISMLKSPGVLADTNASGRADAGDTLTYAITLTNTGNVTLSNVVVTDPLPGAVVNGSPVATLNVGAPNTSSVTVTYVLTPADVNAGRVLNQASVTASPPLPALPVSDTSDPTSGTGNSSTNTPILQTPSIAIIKAATTIADTNSSGRTDAGDIVSNVISVRNTGTVTLTNIVVTDPKPGVTVSGANVGTLAAGATSVGPIVATYTLTQADIDAGTVSNQASVSGTPPSGPPVNDVSDPTSYGGGAATTLALTTIGSIAVVKTASVPTKLLGTLPLVTDALDTISYTFTVTNTGAETLTSVGVTDVKLTGIVCAATTLAPNASTQCTANPYPITLAEMNAGEAVNQATASGTRPSGPVVTDQSGTANNNDDQTRTALTRTPQVALVKTAGAPTSNLGANNSVTDAGDTITYTFTVTNTGSVTVSGISVADPKVPGITCPITPLAPTFSTTCTGPAYALTQSDIDNGSVSNQATVSATPPSGPAITDSSDPLSQTGGGPTITPISQTQSVALIKAASAIADSNGNGMQDAGDRITYSFTVTNTGTVTVYSLRVTDPLIPVSGLTIASLAPGASNSTAFSAVKVLTQADIDAGSYANQAVVNGFGPLGPVTDSSDPASTSGNNQTVVTITPARALRIEKSANRASFNAPLQTINYSYVVTNTGNVTLSQPFTVADNKTTVTCPVTPLTLAPNQALTCTASYSTTQADVDAGSVTNTATATSGSTTSAPDSVTVPSVRTPNMTVAKSTVSPVTSISAGDVIAYQYVISNTGNVTLDDTGGSIVITDNLIPSVSCPAGNIAVGGSKTCTASYTITADDIAIGVVTNTARASNSQVTSPVTSLTIPDGAVPALSLVKTAIEVNSAASPMTFDTVGDIITYNYLIDNSGNVDFATPITVTDNKNPVFRVFNCINASVSNIFEDTDPAESCLADYTVTQQDLDRGFVTNDAVAQTIHGAASKLVASNPGSATVNALQQPALTVTKTTNAPVTTVGQILTYTIAVENTGNVTVSGISISDPLIPSLSPVNCTIASLAPGATSNTCTGTYRVTQADIDAGSITNTATASGATPQGAAVTDTGSVTTPMPTAAPAVTVDKVADVAAFADPGQTITYNFRVTNTGNVTLTNVTVTDVLIPAFNCVIPTLQPGITDAASCSVDYIVTQADIDRSFILNTANVAAIAARGTNPTATDNLNTAGPLRQPGLLMSKTTSSTPTVAGQTLVYNFEVFNAGNVTITALAVTDAKCATPPTFISGDTGADGALGLAEVHLFRCTSIPVTQAEVDAGTVNNSASVTGTPAGGTLTPAIATAATTIPSSPSLALVKRAGTPTVNIGLPGITDAGDTVTYAFDVTNTGTVTLNPITIADAKVANIVCPATPLAPAGTITCTGSPYTITLADMNAGSITNTATASGTAPSGTIVTDRSGTAPNNDLDTLRSLDATPRLALVKTAGAPTIAAGIPTVPDAGDTIAYSFVVTNTGSVSLSAVTVVDAKVSGITCAATSLAPGVSTTCSGAPYTITLADMDAGSATNTATASGLPPFGAAVSDRSGTDPTNNADTVSTLAATPRLALVKTAASPTLAGGVLPGVPDAGDTIAYSFVVSNTGSVTLNPVAVSDAKVASIVCASTSLAPGASTTCAGQPYVITAADMNAGSATNTATVTGKPPVGPDVSDRSGTDPANNLDTVTPLIQSPRIALLKSTSVPTIEFGANPSFTDAGDRVSYRFVVRNEGSVTVNSIAVSDAKVANISCGQTSIDAGASTECTGEPYVITAADIEAQQVTNTASMSARSINGALLSDVSDDPSNMSNVDANGDGNPDDITVLVLAPPPSAKVTMQKTASVAIAKRGDVVSYSLRFANDEPTAAGPFNVIDTLPQGLNYIAGSATLDGSPVNVLVSGRQLTVQNLLVKSKTSQTIKLTVRIGDVSPGKYTNKVQAFDRNSAPVSNLATATITVSNEAVFDCGDIIGKVFDDKNRNGVQNDNEPGIAGVRLATVKGVLITTDQYGRYNVPCAELPDAEIGSNFILKLDMRTLPTGYRLTTENPKTVRLTAGKLTKMNFGVALAKELNVALSAKVFVGNSVEPVQKLQDGIEKIASVVDEDVSVVLLTYNLGEGESRSLAKERLKRITDLIRTQLKDDNGSTKIPVETKIVN